MKPQAPETWPPAPTRPQPEDEANTDDDDWLAANDLVTDITWREYAVVTFAVLWGLLACLAIAAHHHLPPGIIKNVHRLI